MHDRALVLVLLTLVLISGGVLARAERPGAPVSARGGAHPSTEAWMEGGTLDLNRAREAELRRLPGVGARTAARIVADRAAEGPYEAVEELRRVKGIGPKTVARLRPLVSAGPAAARGR